MDRPGAVERVVLLGPDRQPVGTMPKSEVHHAETPLHLAFSVYVFGPDGRFLVTRRAVGKRTWGGVWTNSCCGHPVPGEEPTAAARRRLGEELTLHPVLLEPLLPNFAYRATAADGTVENEVCPVFVARVDTDPVADPAEVAEWRWVRWADFCHVADRAGWALSPWAVLQVGELQAAGWTGPGQGS